jgi:hypothetical protein
MGASITKESLMARRRIRPATARRVVARHQNQRSCVE